MKHIVSIVIFSEGCDGGMMRLSFFQKNLRILAKIYHVLTGMVKTWMDKINTGCSYVFQQDSSPTHKIRQLRHGCLTIFVTADHRTCYGSSHLTATP